MDSILVKVLNYKYHIVVTLVISSTLVFLVFLAPSFLSVLAYFWPLLLSTALFLVAVAFSGKASLRGGTDSSGDKAAGEGLLDYVAGQPDQPLESLDSPEQEQPDQPLESLVSPEQEQPDQHLESLDSPEQEQPDQHLESLDSPEQEQQQQRSLLPGASH